MQARISILDVAVDDVTEQAQSDTSEQAVHNIVPSSLTTAIFADDLHITIPSGIIQDISHNEHFIKVSPYNYIYKKIQFLLL